MRGCAGGDEHDGGGSRNGGGCGAAVRGTQASVGSLGLVRDEEGDGGGEARRRPGEARRSEAAARWWRSTEQR